MTDGRTYVPDSRGPKGDLYNFIQFDRELKEESRKKEPLHCTSCTSFICDPTIKFLEIV